MILTVAILTTESIPVASLYHKSASIAVSPSVSLSLKTRTSTNLQQETPTMTVDELIKELSKMDLQKQLLFPLEVDGEHYADLDLLNVTECDDGVKFLMCNSD